MALVIKASLDFLTSSKLNLASLYLILLFLSPLIKVDLVIPFKIEFETGLVIKVPSRQIQALLELPSVINHYHRATKILDNFFRKQLVLLKQELVDLKT